MRHIPFIHQALFTSYDGINFYIYSILFQLFLPYGIYIMSSVINACAVSELLTQDPLSSHHRIGLHETTVDMIFILRQLQEKAIEQQRPLYIVFIVFIEFSKDFDAVDRKTLWRVLESYGTPKKLIDIIKLLHERMDAKVVIGGDTSYASPVNNGVKWVVSHPTLFTLYVAMVLEIMNSNLYYILYKEVYIKTRLNGKLFNLGHQQEPAKFVCAKCCTQMTRHLSQTVLKTSRRLQTASQTQLASLD